MEKWTNFCGSISRSGSKYYVMIWKPDQFDWCNLSYNEVWASFLHIYCTIRKCQVHFWSTVYLKIMGSKLGASTLHVWFFRCWNLSTARSISKFYHIWLWFPQRARWVQSRKGGLSREEGDHLLEVLCACAWATAGGELKWCKLQLGRVSTKAFKHMEVEFSSSKLAEFKLAKSSRGKHCFVQIT